MDEKPSLPRRITAAAGGFLLLLVLAVVAAAPADAICSGDTCGGGGGGQTSTFTSVLTVDPSVNGQVTITAGDGTQSTCSAAPCTITDEQTVLSGTRPTTGWPSYTLHWSGSHVTWDGWSGACSGWGDCTVVNDVEAKTAIANSHVVATAVTVNVPSPTYRDSVVSASATGDLGPFTFEWKECGGLFQFCNDVPATNINSISQLLTTGLPNGEHSYALYVKDSVGNLTRVTTVSFTLQDLGLHVSTLGALTSAPSATLGADDPSVTADRFRCQATAGAAIGNAWLPCSPGTAYAPTLTDGMWTIGVQAIGNSGVTQMISRTTTVDTTAPTIEFGSRPAEGTTVATDSPRLAYTSSDAHPGTTTCTVDGVDVAQCSSPIAMSGLGNGRHAVAVTSVDAVGNTATAMRRFSVALPSQLAGGAVPSVYGHLATLTAHITPGSATGTVTFRSAGRTVCSAKVSAGAADCTGGSGLLAGSHSVTATYAGGYAASTTSFVLTVAKAATAMVAHASRPTISRDATETISATGLPSGTVSVLLAGRTLCVATVVRGAARCAFTAGMAPGRCKLSVRYGGDANHLGSQTSVAIRVTR